MGRGRTSPIPEEKLTKILQAAFGQVDLCDLTGAWHVAYKVKVGCSI